MNRRRYTRKSKRIKQAMKSNNVVVLDRTKLKENAEKPKEPVINKKYNRVYIVSQHKSADFAIRRMFLEQKYLVVNDFNNADIVVFTGGSDVSPFLYNQPTHHTTNINKSRDDYEVEIYNRALRANKFMVGICRGGQFLNVMNGGTLWQDVNNHGLHNTHAAYSLVEELPDMINVTSTHHQMINPRKEGCRVLLTAYESTIKEDCYWSRETPSDEPVRKVRSLRARVGASDPIDIKFNQEIFEDVESCYYEASKSFCFQPHPEYGNAPNDCVFWFFDVMEMLIKEAYALEETTHERRTVVETVEPVKVN